MHHAGTGRANRPQAAEAWPIWPELDLVECRSPGLLATEAVHPARPARTLSTVAALFEEIDQVHAADDRRVAIMDRLETDLQPMADSARRRPCGLGGFPHIVRAQSLDAPRRVSPV